MQKSVTSPRIRAARPSTALVALVLAVLFGGVAGASAEEAADTHCVLDISASQASPLCFATFEEARDWTHAATGAQSRGVSAVVVLAVLYNNSNWQASGGTLTLTGSTACGGGGYWTNNFASAFNDWANSVQTYNGCGIVLWEHANLAGGNTGYLTSSGDLGWAKNVTSSWQVW